MPALPARHSLYWASSVFIQKELHTVFLPDVATITFSCNVMIIKLTHMMLSSLSRFSGGHNDLLWIHVECTNTRLLSVSSLSSQ